MSLIRNEGTILIGQAIQKLTNLTSFSLKIDFKNNLCPDGISYLCQGIHGLVNLKYFSLIIKWSNFIRV